MLMGDVVQGPDPSSVIYTDNVDAYGIVPAKRHATINHHEFRRTPKT
jgi:hypothetical protein